VEASRNGNDSLEILLLGQVSDFLEQISTEGATDASCCEGKERVETKKTRREGQSQKGALGLR
jgi:hypothetical protein